MTLDKRAGRNPSGNLDPTATQAVRTVSEEDKRVSAVIHHLKDTIRLLGYELGERIVLIDPKTGRVWR